MNLLNRKKTYTVNTKITQNIVRRSINCLNKKKTNKYHSHCKSSKYSIEKMEQEELKAAKKIQTPVVYNQAKTPSSLLAKTKTAASSFLNKFSSNQPTTPSSIKSKIPESVKSASTTKPMIKTGFSTPTTSRPIVSKTPSTVHTFQTKASFNNINEKRLVNSVTKPTINTYKTPSKTDTNANINLRKNISRTVDCAKTAIRRSIRRLNSPPSKLAQTPNLQKKTPYLASSKIPTVKRDLCKTEGNQRTVNLTRNVNTELRSIKRQSLMARRSSLGLNEDSLIFVTPRQIRRLFESATKVNQDNKIEEEEEIKIQSVKPSSLLKYLIKDRHAEKIKNIQENIIEEVLQPECVNTISEETISKIDSVSNDNNTKQENIIISNILISEEPKVAIEAVQIEENLNLQNIETKESESKSIVEKFQTQEPVMEVEANQMVNTIIHVEQVQKEDIKVSSENESTQTEKPVIEVEKDQKVTTIENIQSKDEDIKINAENESTQTEEPVMEVEANQIENTIDNIQSLELQKEDIKINAENENNPTISAEKIEVTETIQTNESDELKITEVVKNIELQNIELDNDKIQTVYNTSSDVNLALTEKSEEKSEDDLKTIQTYIIIEEEIKIGMLNEIETNIDIPIEKSTSQSEANSSISNQENNTKNKETDLGGAESQVNVDINKIEENYQEELIQPDVVESVHDEQLKENVNISIENEQMNVQINQKIENSLTDENSNNEVTNLIGSVPIEQATENANISKTEEQSNIEEYNQDIEISMATNAETQCSFIDEIPNNEKKQEMNLIESEPIDKIEPAEQNKIEKNIKSITITPETIQEPELKIDSVPTEKETKVSNTKRKRKQPLDEINHDNESKEAVLPVVEPSEEETGVKKRKYTRKNNKTEIQPEIIEKKVEEVEQIVEEQIKPKRTYKKRAAAVPVEQEPSSKFQKENTEPIENERVLTRAQRAKLNQK